MKFCSALCLCAVLGALPLSASSYTIVSSQQTSQDPGWAAVIKALTDKHDASTLLFTTELEEVLPTLSSQHPTHTCFVATPEEASKEFVARVHQLTRHLDDDPYTDTIWGILTGFDAANALEIAQHTEALTIRNVLSGTEIAMDMIQQGTWFSELEPGLFVQKQPGAEPIRQTGPNDSTPAITALLNQNQTDLFIASGHATERDWMIGFRYKNGFFKCRPGQLFSIDTNSQTTDISSPNPKVYMPIGNCLMGHIDTREAMALAWMNSAGVHQMIGYTVPTWYGYAGWGCLDYFVEQPGRFSFAEAVFANHQALLHRLYTNFPSSLQNDSQKEPHTPTPDAAQKGLTPNDARGLLYDRDVLAFYGDPAWDAHMAPAPTPFQQTLTRTDNLFTLDIIPQQGKDSFNTVNNNGSQRGGRPFFALLPCHIGPATIVEGADLQPVITENFVLVPRPDSCDPARHYRVRFTAQPQPGNDPKPNP